MAKQIKAADAVEETRKETKETRRYIVNIPRKSSHRQDIRDRKGNILKTFLFVDIMRHEEAMRDHFERQIEGLVEGSVVAKPGETIELPLPDYKETPEKNANETAQLLRTGVIKEAE